MDLSRDLQKRIKAENISVMDAIPLRRKCKKQASQVTGGGLLPGYHEDLNQLIREICPKVLEIADVHELKNHVGHDMLEAIRTFKKLEKEGVKPKVMDGVCQLSMVVGQRMHAIGLLQWPEWDQKGRKPCTLVEEDDVKIDGLGCTTPQQWAQWYLGVLRDTLCMEEAVNPNVPLRDNWHAIHLVCDSGFLSCQPMVFRGVLALTENRYLNEKTTGCRPPDFAPLMFLCDGSNRHCTNKLMVKELVKRRADIETLDRRRNTPFLKAAATGQTDVCELLVGLSANIKAENDLGQNAADMAQNLGKEGGHTLEYLHTRLGLWPNGAGARQREGERYVSHARSV